ncbi:SDR family NAD(P)-dependent oxidoreductase [Methanospirillum stamsii]|uniref:3-oxoacyl-ACP reductase n=1 Tax=Methanospirillum stamsii TaxID=1277351 RepID=A0A2V2N334_9EURY|nr:SDR family oxidoreductase [Methanospirillum stamsii]PWR69623.1 3-oxoacyl-ACP reductase [Methanospirillum stamsii]
MNSILVTGDSKGLGAEIVRVLLSEEKYLVVGISRSKNSTIEDLENKFPSTYVHVNFDLGNPDEIKNLYLKDIKKYGQFVGLVNNAAIAYDDIVTNARVLPLETMFRINVYAPIIFTKYIIRDMLLNKKQGSFVHISSICAHTGYKGLSMYSATKGAIESFSRTVAREWGGMGIRSNCIAPGFIETGMSDTLTNEQKDRIFRRTSLKCATNPLDVAQLAAYLLSDKSKCITGAVLPVDCGTI